MSDDAAFRFDPTSYGRHIAEDYDDVVTELPTDDTVAMLHELARGGSVLELGIGTGRLALPLARRGVDVHGVDASAEMVSLMRAKPGGADVPVTVGDFATVSLGRTFDVVLLAYNTVFALPSQDAQVDCFRAAARHLDLGGAFVVEAWVPDVGAFRAGKALRPVTVVEGRVVIEAASIHPANQTMLTNKVFLDAAGARVFPANHRYAWPSELDLMARLSGLRLDQRFEDWTGAPFTDASGAHVSVYRKVADAPW